MDTQWDAIIIGAGLGGLSAAAHLAKAGKAVLVLEQGEGPGGYAHGVQRGPYYFDFSLHSMDGVGPGGWAYAALHSLGVLDQVHFERLDPYYVARFPGREITAHADPHAYEAELIRQFPAEADGIRALFDELLAIFRETQRMRIDGQSERASSVDELPRRFPNLIRSIRESWAELLERHLRDPELKAAVSTLWTYCGLPPSRLSATALALVWGSAHHYGAYYPRGGSMALNRALEQVIRASGGEVRYGQRVAKVLVTVGLATGVLTEQGHEASARAIISNASAPSTLIKLVGPEHLPAGYLTRVEVTPSSLSTFNIFLGLDRDLVAEGWPPHELFITEDYDLEGQDAAIRAGDWARVPLVIAHYTGANPDCAPPGGSALTVMSLAPWDYEDTWGTGGNLDGYSANPRYRQLKEQVADVLLARAEQHIPGLRAAIRQKEIATPLTNAQYTLNRGGAVFGYEQSVEGMYLCRLDETTPIANLFLAGAWTVPGGGQSAVLLSGADAARHTLRYLSDEPAAPRPSPAEAAPQLNGVHNGHGSALAPGQAAPDFLLTAVGSGRKLTLADCARRPLVMVFASQGTTAAVGAINSAVRARLPLADQVTVASVFDFGKVPPLFHRLIRMALKGAYKESAQGVPTGFDPADYVLILPDWSGQVSKAYGITGTEKSAAVVLVDRAGTLQAVFQGDDLAERTIGALQWM